MNETETVRILYEDAHLVIIEKPAGMLSQSGQGETAEEDDVVSFLVRREREKRRLPEGSDLEQRAPYIGIVHRLDRGVGGIMVYAKKPQAAAVLSAMVGQRTMTKQYLCVTNGIPAQPSGTYCDLLYKDARQNKVFVVDRARAGTKEAILSYEVLDCADIDGEPYALLRVTLGTGRSHQIRAQLSHHGTPIVADGKYGGRRPAKTVPGFEMCDALPAGTIALFSHRLAFAHPGNAVPKRNGKKGKNEKRRDVFADIDLCVLPDQEVIPWAFFKKL